MTFAEALALLELTSPFTGRELKTAYRQALMVWHPDRFGDDVMRSKANDKSLLINEAFEYLRRALGQADSYPPFKSDPPKSRSENSPPPSSSTAGQATTKPENPPREPEPTQKSGGSAQSARTPPKSDQKSGEARDTGRTAQPDFPQRLGLLREKLARIETTAQQRFGSCNSFLRILRQNRRVSQNESLEAEEALKVVQEHLMSAETKLDEFEALPLPRFFDSCSPYIIFLGILVVSIGLAYALGGVNSFTLEISGAVAAALTLLLVMIYQLGVSAARTLVTKIAIHLADARRLVTTLFERK